MEEFLKLFSLRDIILHTINTVILFVAIRLLVYKPVRKFLNARTERVASELDGAAQKQTEAEALMAQVQETRKAADQEAARAQADGALRAQESGQQLLDAAQKRADELIRAAHEEAEAIKAGAQEEIQAQALTMAVAIAEKMIGRELAVKDNEALVREYLTKVG